jgi:hypothetical protein
MTYVVLCLQTCIALWCVLGAYNFSISRSHPVGMMWDLYSSATKASLLLLILLTFVAKVQRISEGRFWAFIILSLLMVGITEVATGLMLFGD